jgi:hypothetical protein
MPNSSICFLYLHAFRLNVCALVSFLVHVFFLNFCHFITVNVFWRVGIIQPHFLNFRYLCVSLTPKVQYYSQQHKSVIFRSEYFSWNEGRSLKNKVHKTEPLLLCYWTRDTKITGGVQPLCYDNGNVKKSYNYFWHTYVHKASSASYVAGACRVAEANQYGLPPNVRDLFSTDYPACVVNDTTDVLEM